MIGYLDGEDPQNKLRANPFHGEEDRASLAVYTGDMGYLDDEGYLFLKGRRDAMLKVEGNRVYPTEVSARIADVAPVRDVHVVGAPDKTGKHRLMAFVTVDSEDAFDPNALRNQLRKQLPSYMVPADVVVLEDVPRTASGKPDFPALERKAAELMTSAGLNPASARFEGRGPR